MTHNVSPVEINSLFKTLSLTQRIAWVAEHFKTPVFTTSLGMEDQVLTWAIADTSRAIKLATLDTGRLFHEVETLRAVTVERYGLPIHTYQPEEKDVAAYASHFGLDGFYDSVEARKACCHIRKVRPLRKALQNADAWITGLRRGQSDEREGIAFASYDDDLGIIKINPLADWSLNDIKSSIAAHEIPINSLHRRGYPSIGCEPCTRAVKVGEHERAGRWWWEKDATRECGLHVDKPAQHAKAKSDAMADA